MPCSVFRYEKLGEEHSLYVGELTFSEGLALLDPSAPIRILRFGATGYAHHGWATEKDLPALSSVKALHDFLDAQNSNLGLIELEIDASGVGRLGTHDDAECHFVLKSRATLMLVLNAVVPSAHAGRVVHAVLDNPGFYIACADDGAIRKHESFDAYLRDRG